ncbi:hypothetical protein AVEN_175509-1 [Araneus ventricosus]|uniref:Secreted protein n=1 Tax=Araneus ventricosus TaxID=182803 RepID=A0A4Y2IF76_ARAVE|nr:hypothetical protein AVEN_175509-1 [Araneus ventricosus]
MFVKHLWMLFEPFAQALIDFIFRYRLLVLVSSCGDPLRARFTEFRPVHDDCVICTMTKPYCYRNVVYCYTTVFRDELIHFRNMLVCDTLRYSTQRVIPK